MCAPALIVPIALTAVRMARSFAMTSMANRADSSAQDAIEEQRKRQVQAEQRQHAMDAIQRQQNLERENSKKRALAAALNIGAEGTFTDILLAGVGAKAVEQHAADEQLQNRIFRINRTAANKNFDLATRKQSRTMEALTEGIGQGLKVGSTYL